MASLGEHTQAPQGYRRSPALHAAARISQASHLLRPFQSLLARDPRSTCATSQLDPSGAYRRGHSQRVQASARRCELTAVPSPAPARRS
jgi:hypothetical protein